MVESEEDELAESSDVGRDDKEEEDFVLSASALCKLQAVRELDAKIPAKAYAEHALDPKNTTDWKPDLALLSTPVSWSVLEQCRTHIPPERIGT